jgi:carbon storage regulator CsrA
MLVLTRKINESICIDGGIEIMVVQVRGNRVRLGFRAPTDVSIQRKERSVASVDAPTDDGEESDLAQPLATSGKVGIRSRPR